MQRAGMLVTGGSGLLALNWALTMRDHYAVTLGSHERRVSLSRVSTRQVNLESVDSLIRLFDSLQPSLVIHAAGMTSVEACEASPDAAQYVNVELALNVAQACARAGVPLVHISTDHLFSGENALVTEAEPVSPRNVYGRTKAEAELRVLDACPAALVVRTNFYGYGPSYRQSFSDVILSALRAERDLTLFQDVFYTPILMEALVETVHQLLARRANGIFHVVSDQRISKYEFGLKVARMFQLDAGVIKAGRLADRHGLVRRPQDMSLSNQKTCRFLGKKIGQVDEQVQRLKYQEDLGFARELQHL